MRSWQQGGLAWALTLVLLGCGGGGGSSSGGGNAGGGNTGGGSSTALPELSGLFSDAGDQGRRFYISMEANNTGLFAYHPDRDERVLVDATPYVNGHVTSIHPIHRATVGNDGRSVSQFQIDHLLYFRHENSMMLPDQFARVSTDPAPATVTRSQVSSENSAQKLGSAVANLQVLQYDLADPLNTAYAFRGNDGANHAWFQIRSGTGAGVAAPAFTAGQRVVGTVLDPQLIGPGGWLVVASGDLRQVSMNQTLVGGVLLADVEHVAPLETFADGSQLLVIAREGDDHGTLWRFSPGATPAQAGTLTELKNAQNEALEFPKNMWNDTLHLPSPDRMVASGDTLFIATTSPGLLLSTDTQLYRIGPQGWAEMLSLGTDQVLDFNNHAVLGEFLLDDGNHLIWSINGQIERVAKAAPHQRTVLVGGTDDNFDAPELVAYRDGWLFFNRKMPSDEYRAFAAHTDGRPQIMLRHTRWLGASTDGTGTLEGNLRTLNASEVFAWNESTRELSAVSAATPELGRVLLGDLPNTVTNVQMFGLGTGPHRLLQVQHDNSYEVVAVDTRQAHSLRHLQSNLATGERAIFTQPVPGF